MPEDRAEERPTKEDEEEAAPNTEKQGVVFITSTGNPYRDPVITATKLKQYSKNFYGAGVARKLQALFFGDKLELEVQDQKGENNEKLQKELENMAGGQDVKLFSKMKTGWNDRFWLGMAFFNDIWEQQGPGWFLTNLRRLPPESFAPAAQVIGLSTLSAETAVAGDILKGVIAMPEGQGGKIRFFQTQNNGTQKELTKIFTIKDSTCPEVAGEPEILPVTPVLTMLDFAWKSQMQKTNRIAAPILLLKIVNPKGDDIQYGAKLIKNWGSDTGFILRSNMEIVDFNPADTATALETIDKLTEMILDYWVPTNMLSKNGQLIGGNSNSDLNLLYSYIAGQHREIEAQWEPLLQKWLDANGYEEYRAKIHLKDPEIDDSTLKLEQAKVGADTGLLTENEVRARLGADEMTEAELAKLPARVKEAKAEEEKARQAEQFKLQAAALAKGGQPGGQPGRPGAPEPGQPVPGKGNIPPGQKGGPQDPKKKGLFSLRHSRPEPEPGPQYWPDEPRDPRDQDPDATVTKLIDKEEAELNLALDALARAVLAKL